MTYNNDQAQRNQTTGPVSPWRKATKFAANHQVSKTRSGRHIVAPLQFWKNENKRCDAKGNFVQIDAPSQSESQPTMPICSTPESLATRSAPIQKKLKTEHSNTKNNVRTPIAEAKENFINQAYVLVDSPKLPKQHISPSISETPIFKQHRDLAPFCQTTRTKIVPVKRRKEEAISFRELPSTTCGVLFDQGEVVKIIYDDCDEEVDIDGEDPLPPLELHDLPPEVLLLILSFSSFKDIQSISRVNKLLYGLCMDNFLWKNLYFQTWADFVVSHRTSPANIPCPLSPKSVLRVSLREGERTGFFHGVQGWRDHFIKRKTAEQAKEEQKRKQTRLEPLSFDNTFNNKKRRLSQELPDVEDYLRQQREYFQMIDQQPLLVI